MVRGADSGRGMSGVLLPLFSGTPKCLRIIGKKKVGQKVPMNLGVVVNSNPDPKVVVIY